MHRISIPKTFDVREHWSNCDIIGHIKNQGNCHSSWTFAPAEVMSDRLCILSRSRVKFEFSAEDLISCCSSCPFEKNGCVGGYLLLGWKYWKQKGIVSGNKGCKPYGELAYLNHTSLTCSRLCTNLDYETAYNEDLHFGFNYYSVLEGDTVEMQTELMVNGPLQVNFTVYEGFPYYKEGVYQHIEGEEIGGLYLKVLGWGVENGIPYWLVANSWGTSWGNLNGYVKIRRGFNEGSIESFVLAVNAEYNDSITTRTTVETTVSTTESPKDK